MMYIDVGKVRRALSNIDIPKGVSEEQFYAVMSNTAEAIEAIKPANVVHVTRCDECAGWEPDDPYEGCGHCRMPHGVCEGIQTSAEWYCADGEGKDDG